MFASALLCICGYTFKVAVQVTQLILELEASFSTVQFLFVYLRLIINQICLDFPITALCATLLCLLP